MNTSTLDKKYGKDQWQRIVAKARLDYSNMEYLSEELACVCEEASIALSEQGVENPHEDRLDREIRSILGIHWCYAHNRAATHTRPDGRRCCDPKLAGLLAPCRTTP